MRMRKKKNGDKRREALSAFQIDRMDCHEADAAMFFENDHPVCIEIGCGKGSFITQLAAQNPDVNYIAVERVADVILAAMEKAAAAELKNVKFLICNANDLKELFSAGTFSRMYLNFSDPWPKAGHAKRRLTHAHFLVLYQYLLKDNGAIEMKTDNRGLFDFSLEQFEASGFRCEDVTYDLHHSEYNENNIVTEYEANFSAKGFPIHRVVAYVPKR